MVGIDGLTDISRNASDKKQEFLLARAIYDKSKMAFSPGHADERNGVQPVNFWRIFE